MKKSSFLAYALVSISAILALAAFSQTAPPADPPAMTPSIESPAEPVVSTDNATLNLHRWGAVTLFHGLPSDRVNAIAEGPDGLMWFATDNGLVHYDGRNVEAAPFGDRNLEAAPNEASPASRKVLALKFDSRGTLWIGGETGAARFRAGKIETLPELRGRTVTAIDASPKDEITLVTANGEIVRYLAINDFQPRYETDSGANTRQSASAQARPGEAAPAAVLTPETHPAQLRTPSEGNESLPLSAVAFTTANDWAVGSLGRGLLLHQENSLREAVTKPPRPYFISALYNDGERLWIAEQANRQTGGLWIWQNGSLNKTTLAGGALSALAGKEGELWVGSSRQGAYLINGSDREIKIAEHLTFENTAGGLRSNNIRAIYYDRDGVVWFGTDRGVCRFDRTGFRTSQMNENSQSNFIRTLLQTSDRETWAGTNRGLFRLAGRTKETNIDSWTEISELGGRSVYALAEDAAGNTWVGTQNGLFIKAKEKSSFARISTGVNAQISIEEPGTPSPPAEGTGQNPPPDPTAQSTQAPSPQDAQTPAPPETQTRESVRAFARFRGQLYAAIFERGIERIDSRQRTLIQSDAFAKKAICMTAEGDAALWIGTADGQLWRYDGSRAKLFALPDKSGVKKAVRAIAFENGRLWIGTSNGLFLKEGETTVANKPGLDVQGLLSTEDSLWIATKSNGLIKYRREDDLQIRFDPEQGLASDQVFALAAVDETDILIGTNHGITRHRPNRVKPSISFRRLVTDKIYTPDFLTAELPIDYPTKNFLLEVIGLGSRTFPSQFQYEYSLSNKRGDFSRKLNTRDPQFSAEDLKPGNYSVTVRAISRDLEYSEPILLRLRVGRAPFPFATVLLASLLAIAVLAAVWAFRQQRRLAQTNLELEQTNEELHETRLRLANETEAERSRIARDLHDQTLADLRHLLVLTDQLPATVSPSGELSSGRTTPTPAVLRKEIESISSEIRHICEDLSPSALENIGFLPALEWALADAVSHLPADEKFSYEFNCEPDLENRLTLSHIEQIQLYRIVQEALNNICRHARAKHVRLSVSTEQNKDLNIEIEDDGVGFDGVSAKKTGHGVANIRSRGNLIGAQVEWKKSQAGCRFEVKKKNGVSDISVVNDSMVHH